MGERKGGKDRARALYLETMSITGGPGRSLSRHAQVLPADPGNCGEGAKAPKSKSWQCDGFERRSFSKTSSEVLSFGNDLNPRFL